MSEINNDRGAVINLLIGATRNTSPVKIQFGWTGPDGIVRNNYIVVADAPPSVLSRIVRECVMVSLVAGTGLLIPVRD